MAKCIFDTNDFAIRFNDLKDRNFLVSSINIQAGEDPAMVLYPQENGLIENNVKFKNFPVSLTAHGWEYIRSFRNSRRSNQAFIAMAFTDN